MKVEGVLHQTCLLNVLMMTDWYATYLFLRYRKKLQRVKLFLKPVTKEFVFLDNNSSECLGSKRLLGKSRGAKKR